ncbi:hypothetical protein vseg_014580 [Gypsophila vaccaria]
MTKKTQFECFKRQNNFMVMSSTSTSYCPNNQGVTRLNGDLRKKEGVIRVDNMEISVNDGVNYKEGLDLELRLGYN